MAVFGSNPAPKLLFSGLGTIAIAQKQRVT
jgi:hypothetical protein